MSDNDVPCSPPHERTCMHYRSFGDQPCDCGATNTIPCAPGEGNLDGTRVQLEQPAHNEKRLHLRGPGDVTWVFPGLEMSGEEPLYRAIPIEETAGVSLPSIGPDYTPQRAVERRDAIRKADEETDQ